MTEAARPTIENFDCVIVGGGINGCGTFRDLCLQGVRVLLVERDDFCAGASQASSRLMHGGLKYLETGEFRLVKESLIERNMLLATAPHVVRPLECLVPVRSTWGGVVGSIARFLGVKATLNDRGLAITGMGLKLYDLYAKTLRAMPTSRILGRRNLRKLMPELHPAISGGGLYYEGHITHAERLGIELVLDGEGANPRSEALNHAEILTVEDGVLTLATSSGKRQVRPKIVVNAGGAWIDVVNGALGLPTKLMGGSKGSHLVVDNPSLLAALRGRMVYFGTADGRVNLVYPFAGRVLVGSTDIAAPDPDAARCDADEEAYLCAAVAEIFPTIPVTSDQIVARFCGVRPLPRAGTDVGSVTRDHSIETLALPETSIPVLCLIGGKWTTFRAFSEEAADQILRHLGRERQVSTKGLAIGGGRNFPRDGGSREALVRRLRERSNLGADRIVELLDRYGTRAEAYVSSLRGEPETMVPALGRYSREELEHLVRTERVGNVEDLLRRRTLVALSGRDGAETRAVAAEILDSVTTAGSVAQRQAWA